MITTTGAGPIPARLDRLRWSPFHTRVVCGLGGAWILDGLQPLTATDQAIPAPRTPATT